MKIINLISTQKDRQTDRDRQTETDSMCAKYVCFNLKNEDQIFDIQTERETDRKRQTERDRQTETNRQTETDYV